MTLYKVHRVRFFSYFPEPVCCMAYDSNTASLAVARKGGSLEIYNMADNYFCERTIPGHGKDSIQALCWASEKRLFAVGLDGILTEFDLQRLRIRSSMDAFAGPLWCLAASHLGSSLAVRFTIFTCHAVLSISFSFGTIPVQMAVGRRDYHTIASETVVWAVGWLDGGVVAGAESTGRVQLWETTHGTLLHTFDLCSVDVRSLAVVEFYVGTAEGRVIELQQMDGSAGVDRQWVCTRRFRSHSHDVCALACCEDFVVSGGECLVRSIDKILDLSAFGEQLLNFFFLLFFFSLSNFWVGVDRFTVPFDSNCSLFFQKGKDEIACSAVSSSGEWIAYSTVRRVNVYKIASSVRKLPETVHSALCLAFVPHSAKLVVASPDHHLHIVRPDVTRPKLLHSFRSQEGAGKKSVLEFDVSKKKYTPWSLMHAVDMPKRWLERDTPVTHITFNCSQKNVIILHDTYRFSFFDKTKVSTFFFFFFQPLLFVDVLGEDWVVVVERNVDEMQTQLPKAILQKKFGI
uniref:UTP4 small subunit processome component n=1 Tax=Eptatretus burgeri TaxID=7764 RepID=A0A8C4NDK6_EPTBU